MIRRIRLRFWLLLMDLSPAFGRAYCWAASQAMGVECEGVECPDVPSTDRPF